MIKEKTQKKSTRFLKRFIPISDNHKFIGRIYDLSIVELNFETYDELSSYPDCKYVFHVNYWLSTMIARIESLNMAGDMLWLEPKFLKETKLPVSRFNWTKIAADVFLMRHVSILDGALLLTNEVFEKSLEPKRCSISNLRKEGVIKPVLRALNKISTDQSNLRDERNVRFHRGLERQISSDDQAFSMASNIEHWGSGVRGNDRHGRRINTSRYLREGLVELQRDFNSENRKLLKNLDTLYDLLWSEFESRFSPKFNDPKTGFGARSK